MPPDDLAPPEMVKELRGEGRSNEKVRERISQMLNDLVQRMIEEGYLTQQLRMKGHDQETLDQLRETALRYGIPVCGPNGNGTLNDSPTPVVVAGGVPGVSEPIVGAAGVAALDGGVGRVLQRQAPQGVVRR